MKKQCNICQSKFDFIAGLNNRTLRQLDIFICTQCNENYTIVSKNKIIPLNGLYAIKIN